MPISVASSPFPRAYNLISLWEPPVITKYERWRRVAAILKVSPAAKRRLEWIIYYQEHAGNASLTCRHFGIARKTF